ncbi:formylglycine-generating enzyme family protein [Flavitalea sp.]|nr:formylglycine-generating enzyme family protein [Flavitalea sp.]
MKKTCNLILLVSFCSTLFSFDSLTKASILDEGILMDSVPKVKEPEMVLVEGGSYMMGQTSDSKGQGLGNTDRTRQVTVSTFSIGKYEITQAEWKPVMGDSLNFSLHQGCDSCPVEEVSWNEIQSFIRKLNAATGKRYQLPTEAQWEFAARGGKNSKKYKYAGSDNVDEVVTSQRLFVGQAHPVDKNHPNELGIYNMSGNVAEWCRDFFNPDALPGANTDPEGPSTGYGHVIRGGSWGGHPTDYHTTSGSMGYANDRSARVGFRLALP